MLVACLLAGRSTSAARLSRCWFPRPGPAGLEMRGNGVRDAPWRQRCGGRGAFSPLSLAPRGADNVPVEFGCRTEAGQDRHAQAAQPLHADRLVVADALAISTAWLASYWLRFAYLPVDPGERASPVCWDKFLPMLPVVVLAHLFHLLSACICTDRARSERLFSGDARHRQGLRRRPWSFVILIDYAMPETKQDLPPLRRDTTPSSAPLSSPVPLRRSPGAAAFSPRGL